MDSTEIGDILTKLGLGAGFAGLAALVQEMQRPDRELSLALVPKIASALCAGALAVALVNALGIENRWVDVVVAIVAGMVGQAALIDAARQLLHTRYGINLNAGRGDQK